MPMSPLLPLLRASLLAVALGCGASRPPAATVSETDAKLAEVTRIHGGAGPWAVAGFRMGEHALAVLGLARGSFDLEILHFTPREVQYSCIADGAAAATGASVGKLNLTLADAPGATLEVRSGDQILIERRRSVFTDIIVPSASLLAAGAALTNIFLHR